MTTAATRVVVDENIPRSLVKALRDAKLDVIDAAAFALGGTDEALLELAHREGAILVTSDLDFPRLIFAEGKPPPLALIVERRQPCDVERLLNDVMRIVKLGARIHGHVVVLEADDERVRPFPPARL